MKQLFLLSGRLILWGLILGTGVFGGGPQAFGDTEDVPEIYDDVPDIKFRALTSYQQDVRRALTLDPPVLNLLKLNPTDLAIFNAAMARAELKQLLQDPATQAAHRTELFAVRPFRPGDLPPGNLHCREPVVCKVVELFNFTLTSTLKIVLEAGAGQPIVRAVNNMPNFQPDIPAHLQDLAVEIARRHPAVKKRLGLAPEAKDFVMAGTKTAFNRTRCERSQHLCVSPTFVTGNRALWTIVDLVDGRVVGTRFTDLQSAAPVAFTEQQLRDEHILEEMCEKSQVVERNGWKFRYHLTSSDGLELVDAAFQGAVQFQSAKNVDWHVSYSEKDGFGYSDAIGCPLFSAAAVVPARLPKIKDIVENNKIIGFELHQDFMSKLWPLPCNYYYEQRFQFFNDGRFRVAVASVGRGCGVPGWYRPVVRIAFPFRSATFAAWDGKEWKDWEHEGYELQTAATQYTKEGYRFRVRDSSGRGLFIEPGRGQFGDKGRGDNAYTYLVRDEPERDEGKSDLPTIGPCCNTDAQQGPERYVNDPPEVVKDSSLVFWYVPQLVNDATPGKEYCWGTTAFVDGRIEKYEYPCIAGPMFIPFSRAKHVSD